MKKTLLIAALCTPFLLLRMCQFNSEISSEDLIYADSLLLECDLNLSDPIPSDFDAQIKQITELQRCVIRAAAVQEEIPKNHTRNLKDLFKLRQGLCYDLCYAIEKLLRIKGYEIRHVSIYHKQGRGSLRTVLSPSSGSHAFCEVKTSKGWMIVDSSTPFIGLHNDKEPMDIQTINNMYLNGKLNPNEFNYLHELFMQDNFYIYGLYSRHGHFYPPYNFIPDYQFCQLFYNFQ